MNSLVLTPSRLAASRMSAISFDVKRSEYTLMTSRSGSWTSAFSYPVAVLMLNPLPFREEAFMSAGIAVMGRQTVGESVATTTGD